MENNTINKNISAVEIAENNTIKENKSLMQRMMTVVVAVAIALFGMVNPVEVEARGTWCTGIEVFAKPTSDCCIEITIIPGPGLPPHPMAVLIQQRDEIGKLYPGVPNHADWSYDPVNGIPKTHGTIYPNQPYTYTLCALPGESQVRYWISVYYSSGQGDCPFIEGTINLPNCCKCPSNHSNWLTLKTEDGGECGPDMCKVTPTLNIPADIKCYQYFEYDAFIDGVPVQGKDNIPIADLHKHSICVPKGKTVTYNLALLRKKYNYVNFCHLTATSALCDPSLPPPPPARKEYPCFEYPVELDDEGNPKEDTIPKGCGPNDWAKRENTIYLPDFPNCPIHFTYDSRWCKGELQIAGLEIRFFPYRFDCWDLYWWLVDGSIELGPINSAKVKELFEMAYRALSDFLFNEMLEDTDPRFYDCNDPKVANTTVTFIRKSCSSTLITYYWNEHGERQIDVQEDDCSTGGICCKISRSYCYDLEVGEVRMEETIQLVENENIECDPSAVPDIREISDIYENEDKRIIFIFQTPCSGSCEEGRSAPAQKAVAANEIVNSEFNLYPNPVTDNLIVSFPDGDINKLEIVDAMGKVYLTLTINATDKEAKMNIANLSTGVYYVAITDSNGLLRHKKFIKE